MHTPKSSKLLELKIIRTIIITLLIPIFIVAIVSFLCSIFYRLRPSISWNIFQRLATNSDGFVGEDIGVIFSVLGTFLLIYTIIDQFIEKQKNSATETFYKMVEFHNNIVNQLSVAHIDVRKKERSNGRRAFVIFKIQISKLLDHIQNSQLYSSINTKELPRIVYTAFYYGVQQKKYKNKEIKLGRSNLTSLSPYFQNMYNTIKFVDNNKYLSLKEKQDLITIYIAQLSTPELYVLAFHLESGFWENGKDNVYIKRYNLFRNLPENYCKYSLDVLK